MTLLEGTVNRKSWRRSDFGEVGVWVEGTTHTDCKTTWIIDIKSKLVSSASEYGNHKKI